jgi:hypothetical protein
LLLALPVKLRVFLQFRLHHRTIAHRRPGLGWAVIRSSTSRPLLHLVVSLKKKNAFGGGLRFIPG